MPSAVAMVLAVKHKIVDRQDQPFVCMGLVQRGHMLPDSLPGHISPLGNAGIAHRHGRGNRQQQRDQGNEARLCLIVFSFLQEASAMM